MNFYRAIPFALFTVLAGVLLYLGQNLLSYGADGIQYVQIAKEYAAANWSAAINAYWGPMVSWLMIPFLKLGVDPFFAFKLERFFTALLCFWLMVRWLDRIDIKGAVLKISLPVLALLPLQWMLHETPDLLYTVLVLWWLELADVLLKKESAAWQAALAGALLYFTKAFGFPFFITNLIAVLLLLAWYHRDAAATFKLLSRGSVVLGIFFGLCLPWILTISIHYEEPLLGTSGTYNQLMLGPENSHTDIISSSFILPTFAGDLEAPAEHHISSWQEPFLSLDLPDWSITENVNHYILNIFRNVKALGYSDMIFALGLLLILSLFFLFRSKPDRRTRFLLLLFLITALNTIAGYLLILVQDRYLWPVELLMLFSVILIADRLYRIYAKRVLILLAVALAWIAVIQIGSIADSFAGGNNCRYEFELAKEGPFQGERMAAIGIPRPGTYRRAALYASYKEIPFYGLINADYEKSEINRQLDSLEINLVFQFHGNREPAGDSIWSVMQLSLPDVTILTRKN